MPSCLVGELTAMRECCRRTILRRIYLLILLPALFSTAHVSDAAAASAICAGEQYVLAPDERVFCEEHFNVKSTCTGQDQLAIVKTPWEKTHISIRGITIAFISSGITSGYVFSGNSFNHDVMAWLDPVHEGVARVWFPDGLSFQFPGITEESGPERSRVDLHVLCTPVGAAYSGWLIIYYTIP